MIEETKVAAVQVQPVADAQALATIEAARIAADAGQAQAQVQADAALEAARITAEATIYAGEKAFDGGLIAAVVAGVVALLIGLNQIGIQRHQTKIQEKLALIETTKIKLDLVERRTAFIEAIGTVFGLMMSTGISVTEGRPLPADRANELKEGGDTLEKEFQRARFLFDDSAEPVLMQTQEMCLRVYSIAGNLKSRPEYESEMKYDVHFNKAWNQINDLHDLSHNILIPLTKPDLETLTSIEAAEAKKSLAERAWSKLSSVMPKKEKGPSDRF